MELVRGISSPSYSSNIKRKSFEVLYVGKIYCRPYYIHLALIRLIWFLSSHVANFKYNENFVLYYPWFMQNFDTDHIGLKSSQKWWNIKQGLFFTLPFWIIAQRSWALHLMRKKQKILEIWFWITRKKSWEIWDIGAARNWNLENSWCTNSYDCWIRGWTCDSGGWQMVEISTRTRNRSLCRARTWPSFFLLGKEHDIFHRRCHEYDA